MGNNDGRVIIQVDTNAAKAAKDFNQLDNALKSVNSTAQNTKNQTNGVSSGFNNLSSSLFPIKGAVMALGGAFAAMKLTQVAGDVFKISGQFEQLNVAFEVLAGKQAGQQLVKDLTDLANVTPMTTQGLADNARLLLAFGESSENVIGDLKLLGDISGGNQQKMDALALAFAQAGSAGRLMGQDLLQMVNAGFNPLQIISEKTGKSMFQLRKEMEDGKISFDMIKQAMIDATSEGGRFYGMMIKQSETLQGRLSTLNDKISLIGKSIGDVLLPAAKKAVDWMIKWSDSVLELGERIKVANTEISNLGIGELQLKLRTVWVEQEKVNQKIKDSYGLFGTNLGSMKSYYEKQLVPLKGQEKLIMNQINLLAKQQKATEAASKASSTGFRSSAATTETATTRVKSHKVEVEKVKDAYEKLQEQINLTRQELLVMSAQGMGKGDIWETKLNNYNNQLKRLESINKSIEIIPAPTPEQIGAYEKLNRNLEKMKTDLENMAASGQAGTPAFETLKNEYAKATADMEKINREVTNAVGLDWGNIGRSIASDLSTALTTPLREGENAFQRFGNVAINTIQMIGQKLIEELIVKTAVNSLTGGIGGGLMSLFGFSNGGAIKNGNVIPFASGGIVSSPTMFPMSNGTGLMGEAGAEAIMPLKRTKSGNLGVEATGNQTVNIYNQTDSRIETVKRPNGELDVFIKKVNAALNSERTNSSFQNAMMRQNNRGYQAV